MNKWMTDNNITRQHLPPLDSEDTNVMDNNEKYPPIDFKRLVQAIVVCIVVLVCAKYLFS